VQNCSMEPHVVIERFYGRGYGGNFPTRYVRRPSAASAHWPPAVPIVTNTLQSAVRLLTIAFPGLDSSEVTSV